MSSGLPAATALYAAVSPLTAAEAKPDDSHKKAHHLKNGKGFQNPWPSFDSPPGPIIGLQFFWRKLSGQAHSPDMSVKPTVHNPTFLPTRETPALRTTWLGHACYYVEFPGGLRALFDPVLEERCSPSSWLGPKRYTPAPCGIKDLPFVDAVVISHNHYDHLSLDTVQQIHKTHPRAHFFVPIGNKKWFAKIGITNVSELDWWESCDATFSAKAAQDAKSNGVSESQAQVSTEQSQPIKARLGFLPGQHMTARSGFDAMTTLWGSWSVETGGKKLWFAGDTAYRTVPKIPDGEDDYSEKYAHLPHCPAHAQIGQHRGPFDVGLIPIGAYEPRFIMSPVHANPEDSVNIFRDTRCKRALAMHWGTWILTDEDVMEPPEHLKKALKKHNIAETGVFDVCDIGQSIEFGDS